VHYIYRAPASTEDDEIKCETWRFRDPQEVVRIIDSVGQNSHLRVDHPGQQGKDKPKQFKVLDVRPAEGFTNVLLVTVSDPDS
jgi:hypothetical protein